MKAKAIQLLRDLTEAHSAPGAEGAVRSIFANELADFNLSTDKLGSVVADKPADGPRVLICGHMDEVGFMVQNITSDGFIQFTPVGGWWGHTLLAQRVRILTRKGGEHIGVICSTPPHFLGPDATKKVMAIDKMFIDIGAVSREDVTERYGIKIGDSIVPDSRFEQLTNPDIYMAKAFDNRVGMALAIQAMQELKDVDLPNHLFSAGSVQEEIGTRGAESLSALVKPDLALILEGPPADDTPGFNRKDSQGKLTGGVQLRLYDPSAIMNRKLADFVAEFAESKGINYQVTVRRNGGTDAKAIQRYDIGVPVVVIGVPARYIHTHNSLININDYLDAVKLMKELVPALDSATVNSFSKFL